MPERDPHSIYYCLICGCSRIGVSGAGHHPHCLACGSPEIGMRDTISLKTAAHWKGVEYHTLSRKLRQYKIHSVKWGRKKLFKVSDIELLWHKLQTSRP